MLFEKLVQANDNINEMYPKQRKGDIPLLCLEIPMSVKARYSMRLTGMNQHTGNWPGKRWSLRRDTIHIGIARIR